MLVRVAGLLRALASGLDILRNILLVLADLVEGLGLSQDLDPLIWIFLLFCLYTRRFLVLVSLVLIIVLTPPAWQTAINFADRSDN